MGSSSFVTLRYSRNAPCASKPKIIASSTAKFGVLCRTTVVIFSSKATRLVADSYTPVPTHLTVEIPQGFCAMLSASDDLCGDILVRPQLLAEGFHGELVPRVRRLRESVLPKGLAIAKIDIYFCGDNRPFSPSASARLEGMPARRNIYRSAEE